MEAWETAGLAAVSEVEWKEKTAGLSEYTGGGRTGPRHRPWIRLASALLRLQSATAMI